MISFMDLLFIFLLQEPFKEIDIELCLGNINLRITKIKLCLKNISLNFSNK